jgi:hypothetical protein
MYDGQASTSSVETARYIDAVRQRHNADAEGALHARLALAGEYLVANLYDDAVELFVAAVSDGHRIWGPEDDRTFAVRLDLGGALLTAGRPLEALADYCSLQVDLVRVLGTDHALNRRCEAGVVASTATYEALL